MSIWELAAALTARGHACVAVLALSDAVVAVLRAGTPGSGKAGSRTATADAGLSADAATTI